MTHAIYVHQAQAPVHTSMLPAGRWAVTPAWAEGEKGRRMAKGAIAMRLLYVPVFSPAKTENIPLLHSLPTDKAHQHTGLPALIGHTRHTDTNGVLRVSVCHIFSNYFW